MKTTRKNIMKKLLVTIAAFGIMASCTRCANQTDFGPATTNYDYALKMMNEDLTALGYENIDFSGLTIHENFNLTDSSGQKRAGLCGSTQKKTGGLTNISINPKMVFSPAPELQKGAEILLMYHEIGHCYCGAQHTDEKADRHQIMFQGSYGVISGYDVLDNEKRQALLKQMVEQTSCLNKK